MSEKRFDSENVDGEEPYFFYQLMAAHLPFIFYTLYGTTFKFVEESVHYIYSISIAH